MEQDYIRSVAEGTHVYLKGLSIFVATTLVFWGNCTKIFSELTSMCVLTHTNER